MILAVDPGKTTGYAGLTDNLTVPWVDELPALEFCEGIYNYTGSPSAEAPIQFVIERFTITTQTAKKAPQAESLEVTGFLRWLIHHRGYPEPVFYDPGEVMKLYSNAVLKRIGWYTVGKEHGRDATRHLARHCEYIGQLHVPPLTV